MKRSASASRRAAGIGVATSNGPIAVRRSSSQYASPRSATSDAHVGPRRALDLELGAVALAPELLEAVHVTVALGHDDVLPAARALVRAPPSTCTAL